MQNLPEDWDLLALAKNMDKYETTESKKKVTATIPQNTYPGQKMTVEVGGKRVEVCTFRLNVYFSFKKIEVVLLTV